MCGKSACCGPLLHAAQRCCTKPFDPMQERGGSVQVARPPRGLGASRAPASVSANVQQCTVAAGARQACPASHGPGGCCKRAFKPPERETGMPMVLASLGLQSWVRRLSHRTGTLQGVWTAFYGPHGASSAVLGCASNHDDQASVCALCRPMLWLCGPRKSTLRPCTTVCRPRSGSPAAA